MSSLPLGLPESAGLNMASYVADAARCSPVIFDPPPHLGESGNDLISTSVTDEREEGSQVELH